MGHLMHGSRLFLRDALLHYVSYHRDLAVGRLGPACRLSEQNPTWDFAACMAAEAPPAAGEHCPWWSGGCWEGWLSEAQ